MELKGGSVSFDHNKYNYILKYTQRFNLLELRLKELSFIQEQGYFESLNLYFHKEVKLTSGEDYVASWNTTFRADVQRLFQIYLYPLHCKISMSRSCWKKPLPLLTPLMYILKERIKSAMLKDSFMIEVKLRSFARRRVFLLPSFHEHKTRSLSVFDRLGR